MVDDSLIKSELVILLMTSGTERHDRSISGNHRPLPVCAYQPNSGVLYVYGTVQNPVTPLRLDGNKPTQGLYLQPETTQTINQLRTLTTELEKLVLQMSLVHRTISSANVEPMFKA